MSDNYEVPSQIDEYPGFRPTGATLIEVLIGDLPHVCETKSLLVSLGYVEEGTLAVDYKGFSEAVIKALREN